MRKNATKKPGRKNYKGNKHQFPDEGSAHEWRNHVWRHNSLMGSLAFMHQRLKDDATLTPEGKCIVDSILLLVADLRKNAKRDDSRFKQYEV